MAIDWDSVLPDADVNLDHVDVNVGVISVGDKGDLQDAIPDAWKGGAAAERDDNAVKARTPDVIYVRPVMQQTAPVVDVSAWGGGNANVQVKQVTAPGVKTNLMQAANQWASRPSDERFWTIQEMAAQCKAYKAASHQEIISLGEATVVNDRGDMLIMGGKLKGPQQFTHYSFGQLCRTVGAPADYMRSLDGDLAAQCLTSGLKKRDRDVLGAAGNVLIRQTGSVGQVNAFLSGGYSRIWNADIVGRLGEFESRGWRVPPARPAHFDDPRARLATEADVLKHSNASNGLSVKVGDLIAPAGLYASDRDCFAFMVSEASFDVGGSLLNRGFFVSNSEVGDRAWEITSFLYDGLCGNHIVWGASNVMNIRLIHRGQASRNWIGELQRALATYASKGTEAERQAILTAIGTKIADTKELLIEKLFKDKRLGLTKTVITDAYNWSVKEAVLRGNKFSPLSVWGMVCGLTRVSQECGWADQRVAIDEAAGKMMKLTC